MDRLYDENDDDDSGDDGYDDDDDDSEDDGYDDDDEHNDDYDDIQIVTDRVTFAVQHFDGQVLS